MKRPIAPAYTFNPGSATLNLSGIAGFALGNLFAVIDLANGRLVYAPTPGYGASAVSGTTLTLQAPMTGLAAADPLMILYDDGGKPAEDASVQAVTAALGSLATELAGNHGDLTTLHGDLQAVLGDLASGLGNDTTALAALTATGTWQGNVLTALAALLAKLGTRLSVSLDADSVSLTLPAGLALDASVQGVVAALATLNTALGSNHADLAAILAKQPAAPALDASVQAVVAALATLHGDAGTTLHADLGTIAGKIPGLGQAASAASLPVVLASDGPFATNFGSQSDAAATADTGAFSLIALIKRGLARWTALLNVLPASLGAKASAASLPVVLASDQAAIPHPLRTVVPGALANSGDTVVLPVDGMNTGFVQLLGANAWSGALVFEVSGDGGATWGATNMVPWGGGAPVGGATGGTAGVPQLFEAACGGPTHLRVRSTAAVTSGPVAVVAAAASGLKSLRVGSVDGGFVTLGSQADVAATADTGSFSLVALAKRSLARWTALLGVLPASLGTKASAAAFPVVLASDQAALPVTSGKPATAGDTAIAAGGTAQALFAGATPANGWKVANPDPAEDLWVSDSATAAPNGQGSYRIPAGGIVTTEPGERPAGPVSVYGASTGHLVTARSW